MNAVIVETVAPLNVRSMLPSAGGTSGVHASFSASSAWNHPLVARACQVSAPGPVRSSSRSTWDRGDPDRMVMLSCFVSFVVMPFLL
jgi:hypothetical protein